MIPDFPQFIPLSIELKDDYNTAVRPFTPYADITFAALQIWWNVSEELKVAKLNDNLVIDYNLFHDKENSGLSLVGTRDVEESMKQLFDYLENSDRPKRLVHVPEFVVESLLGAQQFEIQEEADYSEYILDSAALAKLEGPEYHLLRKKIRRFERSIEEKKIDIKSLDLTLEEVQDSLFKSIAEWQRENRPDNDPDDTEHEALKQSFKHSKSLGLENFALYIDDKLHGLIIYHRPLDKEYFILHHLKTNYKTPYISDYIYRHTAKHATENGVTKLNIEMDLGIESLRKHKMTLRPAEFLKKYRIVPKT